jgi:hypothetical protein
LKTDFRTWNRETLEQFARETADELAVLKELNTALHNAWKKEVALNAQIKSRGNSGTATSES